MDHNPLLPLQFLRQQGGTVVPQMKAATNNNNNNNKHTVFQLDNWFEEAYPTVEPTKKQATATNVK